MKQKCIRKHLFAGILAFLLSISGVCYGMTHEVYAATVTVGTVNVNTTLNVRTGPGTSYEKLGVLVKGDEVTIIGEANGWYQISYNSGTAYVSKSYITNVHTVEQDVGYADELIGAGFPSSYASSLAALHSQHPNWSFQPVLTNLDWNNVLDKESALGMNLVPSSGDDAQKSTEAGAYNWFTNQWTGYDGASWVCASREMVAYCMDPRNFLNASSIFQFATNEYEASQTETGVSAMLEGSFMAGGYTDADGTERSYSSDFVTIGSTLNVNPYHLAARCLQEQGKNGTSNSISGTVEGYEGYYNYFNIHAYPANGLTSVQNGLAYAKEQGWSTRYASLYGGAATVADGYVTKGQNTIYFEKFNVVNTISGLYNHQYMTNVQAALNEGANMRRAYTDDNGTVTFWIPVYNNMPETACTMPSGGNPNNWLASLGVEGGTLAPEFRGDVVDYSLNVAEGVSSLRVNGNAVASTSAVSGLGEIPVKSGEYEIRIVCTAQNQTSRTYTLHVNWASNNLITGSNIVSIDTEKGTAQIQDLVVGTNTEVPLAVVVEGAVYRMYNPNSGEHFYTKSSAERDVLVRSGWNYEENASFSTVAADEAGAQPVYRVYNPNSGLHHYTMNHEEAILLRNMGWRYEGISFYAYGKNLGIGSPQYRLYNPNNGQHHWTVDSNERDYLVYVGWDDEGTAWRVR